jgi:hypothetical protein
MAIRPVFFKEMGFHDFLEESACPAFLPELGLRGENRRTVFPS